MKNEFEELQEESDSNYEFIQNFVNDYCKTDEDKIEFYKHLQEYLDAEIELEKLCNQ